MAEFMGGNNGNVVEIYTSRRDDDNRLMNLPIIELEFEKDILDPYNNWRRKHLTTNEKRNQLYVKGASSLAPLKVLQKQQIMQRASIGKKIAQLWKGPLPLLQEQETKKFRKYTIEATIQIKMRLDKCDV